MKKVNHTNQIPLLLSFFAIYFSRFPQWKLNGNEWIWEVSFIKELVSWSQSRFEELRRLASRRYDECSEADLAELSVRISGNKLQFTAPQGSTANRCPLEVLPANFVKGADGIGDPFLYTGG